LAYHDILIPPAARGISVQYNSFEERELRTDKKILMNSMIREILEQQIEWLDRVHPGSPYIFPGWQGRQRVDCSAVKPIKKAAMLHKSFRPLHGLRHHYAVQLAASGEFFTLDMIGKLLTHKDSAIT